MVSWQEINSQKKITQNTPIKTDCTNNIQIDNLLSYIKCCWRFLVRFFFISFETKWRTVQWSLPFCRSLPAGSDLISITICKQVMLCHTTGGWWAFHYVREMCNVLPPCHYSWHRAKSNSAMCPCVSLWPGHCPEGARMSSVGQQLACLRKKNGENCVFTSLRILSSQWKT